MRKFLSVCNVVAKGMLVVFLMYSYIWLEIMPELDVAVYLVHSNHDFSNSKICDKWGTISSNKKL
jgi:hypothetical protein